MSVKMRLARYGDKKSPFYRIVVCDSRKAREGQYLDLIGTYDPIKEDAVVNMNIDKAKDWIAKGVQPTETVRSILVKQGIIPQSAKLKAPSKPKEKKSK